jgi:hypothetical protein
MLSTREKECTQNRVRCYLMLSKNDPNNPVGRFEFAYILEEEKHWADSLREYQVAKRLAASVKGPMYTDLRGNPYDVDGVRRKWIRR